MMEMKDYTDYKRTVMELIGYLQEISVFNETLSLEKCNKAIKDVIQRIEDDTFNIAIVGEFNRGKSTVINALLGKKNVLPVSIMPCTASINKVLYGPIPSAEIFYKNDEVSEKKDLAEGSDILKQYLTKLTDESSAKAASIKEVLIHYPVEYCRNGVTIIDTPGLNDDTTMTDVTLSVLPSADVAVMVLMAKAPYSQTENEFLESKILAGDLGRVLFVVNGIDQVLSENDKRKIVEEIRDRIAKASLRKVKAVYGEDSKEVTDYKNKLGDIKIYGISARNAIKAKEEKDTKLLEESNFPEFEKGLERFIIEERGILSLLNPINKIKTTSIEIMRACTERKAALEMDLNEFIEKCNKSEQEIIELRKKQTDELEKISDAGQATYQRLIPEVNSFWTAIEKAVANTINTYQICNEDLKKEKIKETQEKFITQIQTTLEQTAQNKSEFIKDCAVKDLQAEADRLSEFEKDFFEGIERIQNCIIPMDGLTVDSSKNDILTTTVINYYTLAGGFYQGFKRAGWKGALVGGVGGIVGGLGAGILFFLTLPATTPALIVSGILAALFGTFSSDWILKKHFPSDKIERFRNIIKTEVEKKILELKEQNDFSVKVKELVDTMFDSLKRKIKAETDAILSDTQTRLSNLKADLVENKIDKTAEIDQLTSIVQRVSEISSKTQDIDDQLKIIINRKDSQKV